MEEKENDIKNNENQHELLSTDNQKNGEIQEKKISIFTLFHIIIEPIFILSFLINLSINLIPTFIYLIFIILNDFLMYSNINCYNLFVFLFLTKLIPLETLIYNLIIMILKIDNYTLSKIFFIILFVIGIISCISSLVYTFIFYSKYKKNQNLNIKKLFYFYFEILALLTIHPFLLNSFSHFYSNDLNTAIGLFIDIFFIILIELFLFITNYVFLKADKSLEMKYVLIGTISKSILYLIIVSILTNYSYSFKNNPTLLHYLGLWSGVLFMVVSIIMVIIDSRR